MGRRVAWRQQNRAAWETALSRNMPIRISEKKRGNEIFRKIWIGNLNGTLDGELVESPQRLKGIGHTHRKKYKALK